MAKHFEWTINEGRFHWHRREESIKTEAEMDGIYAVRRKSMCGRTLLAYYVEWHRRAAWAPLLFQDEEQPSARQTRDVVAPAQSSAKAKSKRVDRQTADGLPIQSFDTLLTHLASRTRNFCRLSSQPAGAGLTQITKLTPLQTRAMELLDLYPGEGN